MREVRACPLNWKHPKYAGTDEYIPMTKGYIPKRKKMGIAMYETCSQGTPISPVKETAEELARWLADNGAPAFADEPATYEQWLAMIGKGYAPSMVMDANGMRSGVEDCQP